MTQLIYFCMWMVIPIAIMISFFIGYNRLKRQILDITGELASTRFYNAMLIEQLNKKDLDVPPPPPPVIGCIKRKGF